MTRLTRRAALALPGALLAAPSLAQAPYPNRAIRMVVPFPPGGGTDNLGRMVARALGDRLGQPVVVENRGGAGGNIGSAAVASAAPDGYTVLFNGNGLAISDVLFRNPGFDWRRDLLHICRYASTPMLLVVHPQLPLRDLGEFLAHVRARPGQLNHGTPGAGTSQHLAAALFDDLAGTRIVHVPYRGTGPSVAAFLSGEVEVMFASVSAVEGLIRDGRMRAIANTAGRRARAWPQLPSIAEALPGYAAELWYTLSTPARTPEPVLAALEAASRDVMGEAAFTSAIMERGFDPEFLSRAELGPAMEQEAARWTPVLRRTGITAE